MCTVIGLIAGVARARLPYAENPVSGDLLGAREDVCARAVPAYGVRKCGMGAWRESGQRHGCGEGCLEPRVVGVRWSGPHRIGARM